MIDTDKYEGHYTDDFARFWVTADDELNADIERANATTNLIDDAPLLLTKVKRLCERLQDATDLLHDCGYYICPTCNQWADRNYDCDNCEVIE